MTSSQKVKYHPNNHHEFMNYVPYKELLLIVFRFFSRDLHYMAIDLPRHTHHSGWHTMHNVICGGAKLMGGYLKVLTEARVKISVVQGDKDQVVPMECCNTIKAMAPHAEVDIIRDANHSTVILGRKKEFARYLEYTWLSSQS